MRRYLLWLVMVLAVVVLVAINVNQPGGLRIPALEGPAATPTPGCVSVSDAQPVSGGQYSGSMLVGVACPTVVAK